MGTRETWFDGECVEVSERDSQRQRVYDAEKEAFAGELLIEDWDFTATVAYVRRVCASKTWAKLRRRSDPPERAPDVLPGREGDRPSGWAGGVTLPPLARKRWLILHELAHSAAPIVAQHDWMFCDTYLKLVSRFLGREAAAKLKAAFKKHRVRFRPKSKRTPTPERRAQLSKQGQMLAAARKIMAKNTAPV